MRAGMLCFSASPSGFTLLDVVDQQVEQRFFEAGRVRHQVPQLDRLPAVAFDPEVEVLVDVVIEIELAGFDLLHHRRPGEQLRDRSGPEQRLLGGNGNALFDVGESVGAREQQRVVLDDRDRRAGDVADRHGGGQHAVEECRGIFGRERHAALAGCGRVGERDCDGCGQRGKDDRQQAWCSCRIPCHRLFGFGALRRPVECQQQRA